MAKKVTSTRPFTTDYGITKGHCATKKSALAAAMRNVILHELKHVTIEDERGKALARIRRESFWGIFIDIPGKGLSVMPGSEPAHLRRVK